MNKVISVMAKKAKHACRYIKISAGLYAKEDLPEYDFNLLLEKWPYRDPCCVLDPTTKGQMISKEVDLSLCIPMYNVENSVITLLEQIESQKTCYKFEVILVDDGSTDATQELARNFIAGKSKYRMIVQENGGLSAARNTAIENAVGGYLTFIDSDDEISENYVEALMSVAISENADIVKGSYSLKRGDKLYYRGAIPGYAWGSVFRANLFDRIRFPIGYWYEDMVTSFLLMPLSKKTIVIETPVAYHVDVSGSLSKVQLSAKNYRPLEHLYLVFSLTKAFHSLGISDRRYLNERLVKECSYLMVQRTANFENETRKQIFLACNALFVDQKVVSSDFSGMERIFVKAILGKDYAAWKLAGK